MSKLFHITLIVLAALSVPVLLFYTFSTLIASVEAALLSVGFGIIYTIVVILIFRWSAVWPRAGAWWLTACLVWGAGVSFLVVMISGLPLLALMENLGWTFVTASFGGAYPEEIVKALGVAVILLSFRQLTRPWHGFATGAMIGLGFEVFENLLYGTFGAMMDPNSDVLGVIQIWLVRVFAGPGLHVVFTALIGWGIGLALFTAGRSTAWRWGVAVGWIFIGFAFHFAWNLMWEETVMQLINMAVVAVFMYPLFIWVWVHAHRSARRDPSQVTIPLPLMNFAELEGYRRFTQGTTPTHALPAPPDSTPENQG